MSTKKHASKVKGTKPAAWNIQIQVDEHLRKPVKHFGVETGLTLEQLFLAGVDALARAQGKPSPVADAVAEFASH